MEESIFTKIIKGEIPCYKIYEDEKTIAFLDINPARRAHTLVVPKVQVDQYIDLSDEDYTALWSAVKKVGRTLRNVTKKQRIGLKIIGTDVPHTHVHLIPFDENEAMYHDETSPKLSQREFEDLAKKLELS